MSTGCTYSASSKGWVVLSAMLLAGFIPSVRSQNNSWINPGDGLWQDATNWSTGAPSLTQSILFITNAGSKTVTVNTTTTNSPATMTVSNVTLFGSGNLLSISNAGFAVPLTVVNALTVTNGASVNLSGSTLIASNTIIGRGPTLSQFTTTDGVFTGHVVMVGTAGGTATGTGAWTIHGGTNILNGAGIALVVGNNGTAGSTGSVMMTGGKLDLASDIGIAARLGGSASFTLADGSVSANRMSIGTVNNSEGSFFMSGGTIDIAELRVGGNSGASGTSTGNVVITGGTIIITNGASLTRRINLGRGAGIGHLTISNGHIVTIGVLVGASSGANEPGHGTYTLVGGTNKLFNVSNSAQKFSVGTVANCTGVVLVAGTGLLDAGLVAMSVGEGGVGTLAVSNNGTVLARSLFLGSNTTAHGTLTMAGGNLIVTNAAQNAALVVGMGGTGSMTLNAGSTTADSLIVTNGVSSIFTFNAGELNTRASTFSNGSLTTAGDGVNAAIWNLLGGTHSFADDLVVNTNATLKGNGTIMGDTTVRGTLSPGQSPGLIDFVGDLTLDAGSTNVVELNGLTPGLTFDHLNVQGGVDLTDSILSLSLGFSPNVGDTFIIISNDLADAVTGTFAGLAEGSSIFVGTINEFSISYLGGDGNDVMLTFLVPEPGSPMLALLGGLALLRRWRGKRNG